MKAVAAITEVVETSPPIIIFNQSIRSPLRNRNPQPIDLGL
jgi:hypothetical protein